MSSSPVQLGEEWLSRSEGARALGMIKRLMHDKNPSPIDRHWSVLYLAYFWKALPVDHLIYK